MTEQRKEDRSEQLALFVPLGAKFTSRGLDLPPDMSYESWIDCGRFLKESASALDFWKADWLRFGRVTFGMDRAAEAAGQLEFQMGELKRVEALNQLVERSTELSPEHHFVLAKANWGKDRPNPEAWSKMSRDQREEWKGQWHKQWIKMAEKEHLSPRELQESIRMGSVTRIKIDPDKDRGVGFASFESWYLQWKLLRKQIEDVWRDWTPEQAAEAMTFLQPVVDFAAEVRIKTVKNVG
jgi:hypothetical protein